MSKPVLPNPAYIYHPSEVEGEDELFDFSKSGNVACPQCIRLYTEAQVLDLLAPKKGALADLSDEEYTQMTRMQGGFIVKP